MNQFIFIDLIPNQMYSGVRPMRLALAPKPGCRRGGVLPPQIPFSLGTLRYRGIWPPSNPGRVPGPDREFCPLIPKPQLPPCIKQTKQNFEYQYFRTSSELDPSYL